MIWRNPGLALLVIMLSMAAPEARAECISAPDLAAYQVASPEDFAVGATRSDRLGRVVAPVMVNGAGPFRFIVDTGANRSVLSADLVERLGLAPFGVGEVHSVHGVTTAPLVRIDSLRYGNLPLGTAAMPVLGGPMLAGESGLLGVDGLRGRRLRMDFENNCIEIVPAQTARRLRGWTSVRGELRFGHLVVVRGSINGVRTHLLIDTGSDTTLANIPLLNALAARLERRRNRDGVISYTAGDPLLLEDSLFLRHMRFGALEVENVRAYVGDFHIFRLWGLSDEPTLLVGMDVLSRAHGLAIDYSRGTVSFKVREGRTGTRISS